eukprot:TRINITY_DN2089_c0_g1_i1.p1 TRINITY_DN2089_c0_g1~~TRINITY_DN2089_c0_g1_i1.p1  ORF type:complete len:93 (+),score=2.96 TRINITY_DN2089_c0_g1_i1:139-417(+)
MSLWVLVLCSLGYINNQSNRYLLSPIASDLEIGANFGDGQGDNFEYGMLTGPITTLPYCLGILLIGPMADHWNKVLRCIKMVRETLLSKARM